MEELRKTKGYVEYALRNYPECRDSDDLLYERVCVMKGCDTRNITLEETYLDFARSVK